MPGIVQTTLHRLFDLIFTRIQEESIAKILFKEEAADEPCICEIDSKWEFAVWLRELKLGLCDNLERWDGVGVGREIQEGGDICILVADSCSCLTEAKAIL